MSTRLPPNISITVRTRDAMFVVRRLAAAALAVAAACAISGCAAERPDHGGPATAMRVAPKGWCPDAGPMRELGFTEGIDPLEDHVPLDRSFTVRCHYAGPGGSDLVLTAEFNTRGHADMAPSAHFERTVSGMQSKRDLSGFPEGLGYLEFRPSYAGWDIIDGTSALGGAYDPDRDMYIGFRGTTKASPPPDMAALEPLLAQFASSVMTALDAVLVTEPATDEAPQGHHRDEESAG